MILSVKVRHEIEDSSNVAKGLQNLKAVHRFLSWKSRRLWEWSFCVAFKQIISTSFTQLLKKLKKGKCYSEPLYYLAKLFFDKDFKWKVVYFLLAVLIVDCYA